MKKPIQILIIFTLLASVLSCSSDENIDELVAKKIYVNYLQIDFEILELLNAHRITLGLSQLKMIDEASSEAIGHNDYMIDNQEVSHDYFGQRSTKLKSTLQAKLVGENVAYGFSEAESVVAAWLNSPGHKAQIVNPKYTHIGVSTLTDSDNKNYYTNIFIQL